MEKVLASVVASMDENYPLLFWGTWSFSFHPTEAKCIGKSLDADWIPLEIASQKYLGIRISFEQICDPHLAYSTIIDRLNHHQATAYTLQEHYCVWHRTKSLSLSNEHTLISCGYDDQGLYCTDCHPPSTDNYLSKKDFFCSYNGLLVSFFRETATHKPKESLSEALAHILHNNDLAFSGMDLLADHLRNADISHEITGTDEAAIWNSPLLYSINNLSVGRSCFAAYLSTLSVLTDGDDAQYSCCADLVRQAGKYWALIRSLLIKAKLCSNPQKYQSKAYELIHECRAIEERALRNLLQSN